MKAIYSTSNNFGAASVKFYVHTDERIAVLTGRVPLDVTDEDYLAAETLQIDFPANTFPFERSEVAFAYLCAFNEGERIYSAPVRARIVSRSRIEVEKIDAYDSYSHDVELYFNSGFIVQGDDVLLQPTASQKLTFKNLSENKTINLLRCHNRFEEGWGFLSVIFEYLTLPAESDYEITVTGIPADAECDVLVFLAACSNHAGPGCRVSKARLENGKLIIHNESEYKAYDSKSFVHIFFTRVQRYTLTIKKDADIIETRKLAEGEIIEYPDFGPEYNWLAPPATMPARDHLVWAVHPIDDPDL